MPWKEKVREPWALIIELLEVKDALAVAEARLKQAEAPGLFTIQSIDALSRTANGLRARQSLIEDQLDQLRDKGELAKRPRVPELKTL